MNYNISLGCVGEYKIQVIDGNTKSTKIDTGWIPNLITDIGMEAITTGWDITTCHIGSGTTLPAGTDTSLETQQGDTAVILTDQESSGTATPYTYAARTLEFGEIPILTDFNLTEVGISGIDGLFSRVVLDTAIPVVENDSVLITYQVRLLFNSAPTDSGLMPTGGPLDLRVLSSRYTSGGQYILYTGMLGAITPVTSNVPSVAITFNVDAYVPGSYQYTANVFLQYYHEVPYQYIRSEAFNFDISSQSDAFYQLDIFETLAFTITYTWSRA